MPVMLSPVGLGTAYQMPKSPHTSFPTGKRIVIILHGGEQVTGKFMERRRNRLVLYDGREIPIRDVRSATIKRGK